jgi:hypothetical protein
MFINSFPFCIFMNSPVNLNYQPGGFTVKIGNVSFDYLLTAEFYSELIAP